MFGQTRKLVKTKALWMLFCVGAGVFLVAESYDPGGGRLRKAVSFEPGLVALGCVFLVSALLIYRRIRNGSDEE